LTITDDPIGMTRITIQWYSSPTPSSAAGTGGTAVTGATGNTFAPPANIVNTDGIYYYAVATDRCGSTTATNNTGGKHIVVPLCNSYPGATGVASCTGSAGVAPGIVSWGGSTNIETHARDISGNKITQRWSDVVTTTGCEKTGFTPSNVAADCRNSTNGSGVHYFTWCYVMRYQAQLCPSPWRVPTCQDFINLDVAMGGTGELRDLTDNATSNGWTGTDANEKYTGTAAGTWGGARWTALDPLNGLPDVLSLYWSSSESSITIANDLFYAGIILNPVNIGTKGSGIALRCVRDVP
ncbi:MAG: hypothetical protein FWG79_08935, partial [Bacteroidales bacterium]|nr:hypothetical protein [Bacteroidales bacterium]